MLSLMNEEFHAGNRPDITLEEHEVLDANALLAEGPRGSLLIYSSDVVHKGTNMTDPGGSRFFSTLLINRRIWTGLAATHGHEKVSITGYPSWSLSRCDNCRCSVRDPTFLLPGMRSFML